jgi:uncharacterized protein (DUF885 family)
MRARILLLSFVVGCGGARPVTTTTPTGADDSAAGIATASFAELVRESWERSLREDPIFATSIGDHRYDDRWPDLSAAAHEQQVRARAAELSRARELASQIDEHDRVTYELFVDHLETATAMEVCRLDLWADSPMFNPVVMLNQMCQIHPLENAAGRDAFIARLNSFGGYIEQDLDALRRGVAAGRVGPRTSIERTIALAQRMANQPDEEWVPVAVVRAAEGLTPAERDALVHSVHTAIDNFIRTPLMHYADVLHEDILPHARDAEHEGVSSMPDGAACYAAAIRYHTTTTRTAEDIHALGEREVAATDARIATLGASLFHTTGVTDTVEHALADTTLGYTDGQAIVDDATARVAAAEAAAQRFFLHVPDAACRVEAMPPAEAQGSGFAYYINPTPDGSRPGIFMVNTAEPQSRRRYALGALAAHEAVPGHHFQVSLAQHLPAMPMFRRHGGFTAYLEGWGLYAERLADEMGLYADDLDRLGAADLEAFRAARLVVDTGLHTMGWSRTQAEAYLHAHTSMSEDLVRNEVDRYINWPGQALAYKIGQLEILALRTEAQTTLGDRFDLRAFHDVVLGAGPVTLPVLGRIVRAWIATQHGS